MKKTIRKMLIIQLSLLEVFLFTLLLDNKQTSCIVETEKDNLLVYNYTNTLLSPRIVKEEKLMVDEVVEDNKEIIETIESETIEEEVKVSEEIIEEEVVSEPEIVARPLAPVIRDVNYSVAENLVAYAKQFVGYPYVYGGNSLTEGTDCSGFTKLIYAQYGVYLPRIAYEQSYSGVEIPLSDIQVGDLVLSGYNGQTHHVAIYIGNGQLVHALNQDVGIVITDLYIMPITHVRRVL